MSNSETNSETTLDLSFIKDESLIASAKELAKHFFQAPNSNNYTVDFHDIPPNHKVFELNDVVLNGITAAEELEKICLTATSIAMAKNLEEGRHHGNVFRVGLPSGEICNRDVIIESVTKVNHIATSELNAREMVVETKNKVINITSSTLTSSTREVDIEDVDNTDWEPHDYFVATIAVVIKDLMS